LALREEPTHSSLRCKKKKKKKKKFLLVAVFVFIFLSNFLSEDHDVENGEKLLMDLYISGKRWCLLQVPYPATMTLDALLKSIVCLVPDASLRVKV